MGVSAWNVLGLVLLVLALPFAFLVATPYSPGSFGFLAGLGVGAGFAFVIPSIAGWLLRRDRTIPEDDVDIDSA